MPQVNLKVTQPDEPVANLVVYEAANPTGPFASLVTIPVGAGVVLEEVDVNATLETDWFAVQWKDAAGAWVTPLSPPVKAGATSFVEIIVDRVRQRDRSIDMDIARQEAEAAIERHFSKNPYGVTFADIPEGRQYQTINGLVYWAMARSYLVASSGTTDIQQANLGMISFKSQSGTSTKVDVAALLELANVSLGMNTSVVMELEDVFSVDRWWQVTEP